MVAPITLPPNIILCQVADSINKKINNIFVTILDIIT